MSVKKIENIEEFILDDNLEKYTRKEREIIINELFKNEYQGKEISCILNGEEVLAVVNAYTRKITLQEAILDIMNQIKSIGQGKILHIQVTI